MIFRSLLTSCFLLTSVHASQIDNLENWKVTGNFKQNDFHDKDKVLVGQVSVEFPEKSPVRTLYMKAKIECNYILNEIAKQKYDIWFFVPKKFNEPLHSNLQEYLNFKAFQKNALYYEGKDKKLSPFINVIRELYNHDIIPDSIIDNLIPRLDLTDFRLTNEKFTNTLNKRLTEESTPEDFKKILEEGLKLAKNNFQRQDLLSRVIQGLHENNPNRSLILEYCKEITDPSVPGFIEVKKIESDFKLIDLDEKIPFFQKNVNAIEPLLKISINSEREKLISPLLQNILYRGDGSLREVGDIPAEFRNLEGTEKSVLNLLTFIGQQQEEIRNLKEALAQLNLKEKNT